MHLKERLFIFNKRKAQIDFTEQFKNMIKILSAIVELFLFKDTFGAIM